MLPGPTHKKRKEPSRRIGVTGVAVAVLLIVASALALVDRRLIQTAPAIAAPAIPTVVPTMAITPGGSPVPTPTPTYVIHGTYTPPAVPPPVEIPPPVPAIEVDNDVIENILLLGSDSADNYYRRTDVMILVSINKDAGAVAMWHLPRAMFVYIPNHTMDRINVTYALGESGDFPGGGFGLLQATFRYNFGIELDHYARVNFPNFMRIVEELGRLEISVDCALRDWRLKDPDLDPGQEENWELYTLPIGRQRLTPYTALWYVRSRKTTSDLDRGRRQMDVLRAIWQQAREMGLFTQLTRLWPRLVQIVDTDLTLADALSLAPLAISLDMSQVARYGGTIGVHYDHIFTSDNGREVFLPIRENLIPMIEDLLTPPTGNRLERRTVTVDIIDASAYYIGFELVAADRLAWEGFAARPLEGQADVIRELTVIYDYTGQTKGSVLPDLQRILRTDDAQVIRQPDPNRTVDYRVEIGGAYNSCIYGNAEDELEAGPPILDESEARIAPCWLRFRADVNVRSGPGTNYNILGLVTPNIHLPVTGRNAADSWWQVDYDGQPGWVSGEITTVDTLGDCSAVPVAEDVLP